MLDTYKQSNPYILSIPNKIMNLRNTITLLLLICSFSIPYTWLKISCFSIISLFFVITNVTYIYLKKTGPLNLPAFINRIPKNDKTLILSDTGLNNITSYTESDNTLTIIIDAITSLLTNVYIKPLAINKTNVVVEINPLNKQSKPTYYYSTFTNQTYTNRDLAIKSLIITKTNIY